MNNRHSGLQEWEAELLAREELIPVTQTLIPPDLALAFKIAIDPPSTNSEMPAASTNTLTAQYYHINSSLSSNLFASAVRDNCTPTAFTRVPDANAQGNLLDYGLISRAMAADSSLWHHGADQQQESMYAGYNSGVDRKVENGSNGGADSSEGGSGKRVKKRLDMEFEEANSGVGAENSEDSAARMLKRPRLVWTPQLHKRFVEAVSQLGVKNAVPKMIMQLMNVDGLTRENVASHLQKYRLYLKRMQGLPAAGAPSGLDHLFASTPAPPGLIGSPHFLSNSDEDLMPFLLSVPVGAMPMVGSLRPPLSNTELNMYNSVIRPFALNPSGNQGYLKGSHIPSSSPQNQVLSLFPTNGA